jgi:hypothetical protein
MRMSGEVARTEDAPERATWLSMPTLVACAAAGLALVVVVGLQAPAVSVGLRWVPRQRSRTLELEPLELSWDMQLAANGQGDSRWTAWLIWALAALVTAALLFALVRWLLRRPPATTVARTGADTQAASEAEARILRSGLAAAIEILAVERDLGNAVVQAWQGLQDAAAEAGLTRRPAETASEFTARILYRSRGSAAPIAVLLSLYQRVRFGEHTPTAAEITAARESLAVLVELWQSDLSERRPTKRAR